MTLEINLFGSAVRAVSILQFELRKVPSSYPLLEPVRGFVTQTAVVIIVVENG